MFFTRRTDNYRPDSIFVSDCLQGFLLLPGRLQVLKGDTLWKIAGDITGDPYRYPELSEQNELADQDQILPGQELLLPEDWTGSL